MNEPLHFAVIGAARSGTTTLFEHLRRHPSLFIPARKELPYFFSPRAGFDTYFSDAHAYHSHFFRDAAGSQKLGVVTPQYMYGAPTDGAPNRDPRESAREMPRRLHEFAPNVKLVAILRDPVARAISHFKMNARRGIETRDINEALDALLAPTELEQARLAPNERNLYVIAGEYGRILQGYLDVFGAEQLLITFTSELETNSLALIRRIAAFIGVEEPAHLEAVRANFDGERRRYAAIDPASAMKLLARRRGARKAWGVVPKPVRLAVLRRFDRIARQVDIWNRTPAANGNGNASANGNGATAGGTGEPNRTLISHATLAKLRAHYDSDERHLAAIVSSPLPWVTQSAEPPDSLPAV